MELEEWIVSYIKYKDSVNKKIQDINTEKNKVGCNLKDGTQKKYLCLNNLEQIKIEEIEEKCVIVCLNTKKNLDWLTQNWSHAKNKKLIFFFANPRKSMHWAVNTETHDYVTEKTALKTGLKALFESVPEIIT